MNVKAQRLLLSSAARTATNNTGQQIDPACTYLRVFLNVTAASGTGGLTVQVRGYDKLGNPAKLTAGGGAVTTTGIFVYELSSSAGAAVGDVKETVSRPLPCKWDVLITHGDGSSYTYSLACEVMGD